MVSTADRPTAERPGAEPPSGGLPPSGVAVALPEGASDQELLRSYAEGGDTASLGAFVSRHQSSLLRFAGKLLADDDAAQDVVQETFLQVARRPERLRGVESCHNWLLRVARNIGVSRIRRNVVAKKHAEALKERAAAIQEEAAATAEPAGALEAEETRRAVRDAVDRLHPRYKEVLLLKVQEDKSYKEIAEITGLTVTNVGYLLHRAMKALATRLNHTGEVRP